MKKLFSFFPLFFLGLSLFGRLFLAFSRYFDSDELAYFHWAYLFSHGYLPYRDFFFYIPPLFLSFLSPIFFLPPHPALLILGRLFLFGVYISFVFFLFLLTKKITRNSFLSSLTAFLFSLFPMTFDKSLEVRPDQVMLLFFLFSLLSFWAKKFLLAGFLFSLSLLVLPKMFFALPALFLLFFQRREKKGGSLKNNLFLLGKKFLLFSLGATIPLFLFFLYLGQKQILSTALLSLFSHSLAVNSGKTPFSPLLALSPWPLVYLEKGGVSLPWLVNSLLFLSGFLGFLLLFCQNRAVFSFSFLYLFLAFSFLFLFPAPYLQYFLVITPLISFLAAYFLFSLSQKIPRGEFFLFLLSLIFLFSFFQQYQSRRKSENSNQEQLKVIAQVLAISSPKETFYDSVGSYVFRPDGYFICCHPYGEFFDKLKIKLPSLKESLLKNQTKFLLLDRTGLLFWKPLPSDLSFLRENYLPSSFPKIYTPGVKFACEKGFCRKIDALGNPASFFSLDFEIIIPETYRLILFPKEEKLLLDGKKVSDSSLLSLEKGKHVFSPSSSSLTFFQLQLAR